jgi:hypothetical protein
MAQTPLTLFNELRTVMRCLAVDLCATAAEPIALSCRDDRSCLWTVAQNQITNKIGVVFDLIGMISTNTTALSRRISEIHGMEIG